MAECCDPSSGFPYRRVNAHGVSATGETVRDPHKGSVEINGRGEMERRTRGLRIMDWDNVHCLRFGFAEFGRKGVKRQAGSMLFPQALGPLASHMEINRHFASCPPIVFNPPSIDRLEQSRTA